MDLSQGLSPDAADYLGELSKRPGARAPATFSEIWNAEWTRTGLDTIGGVGRPLQEAYRGLSDALEREGGAPVDELARAANVNMGAAATFDQRVALLGAIADSLPEETRKRLEPLRDVRKRASDEAQRIEREASDVAGRTYGLSGVATSFLAGVARQTVDPVNIAAMVATAPLGGTGGFLKVVGREALANAGAQAVVEPYVEATRAELGLEAGFGRAAANVAEAAAGGAALSALFRGAGAAVRAVRRPGASARGPELADWSSGDRTFTGYLDSEDAAGLQRGETYADRGPSFADLATLRAEGEFDIARAATAAPTRESPRPLPPEIQFERTPTGYFEADDIRAFDRGRRVEDVRPLGADADVYGGSFSIGDGAAARPTRTKSPAREIPPSDVRLSPLDAEDFAALDRGSPVDQPLSLGDAGGRGFDLDLSAITKAFDAAAPEDLAAAARLAERDRFVTHAIAGETPQATAANAAVLEQTAKAMEQGAPVTGGRAAPVRKAPKYGPASRPAEKYSLFEFLVSRGGLNPDQPAMAQGWLQKILDGNPNVPFFGKLMREGGLTLDRAWEAAVEAGYINDAGYRAGTENQTSLNTLLDLIDQERRGTKVYREGHGPEASKADIARAKDELDNFRGKAAAEFDARMKELEIGKPAKDLRERALQIMERESVTDPLAAYEKALLERDERSEAIRRASQAEHIDVPGWDVPDEAGRSPAAGEAPARGSSAGSGDAGSGGGARPGGEGDRGPGGEGVGKLGDPALAADAERALSARGGDFEVTLQNPDGTTRKVSAREALAEADADAKAAQELVNCVGGKAEAAE